MMISRPSTDHQFAGQLIVGTDGSLESDGAARWAVADAARHHLDVVLAHGYAVADRHRRAGTRTLAALRLEHEQRVEQAASRLIVPPDMVVHRLAEPTEPATLLARLSRVAGAVVIGQHQRASTPVPDGKIHAVVASAGAAPVVSVPATWQASLDRRPVMVALDGHRTSASTLAYAFDQAAARQVALLAIHAVPLNEIPSDGDGELRNLAEVLAGWKGEHPDQEVRTTLAAGSPRDALSPACDSTQLLIVGGSTSRFRWTRWSRSVARAVLRQAHCPVAVIPHQLMTRDRQLGNAGVALPVH